MLIHGRIVHYMWSDGKAPHALAIVTSTSTPVSKFIDVTCLTNSLGECKSTMRLCTRIWK